MSIIFVNINYDTKLENILNEVNNLMIEKCGLPQELLHNEYKGLSIIKMQNEKFKNNIIKKHWEA